MKEEILEEIMKECNWWERVVIKILKKLFIKIYHIGRIIGVKGML